MNKNKLFLITFCIFLPLFLLLLSYQLVLGFVNLTENQQQTVDFLENKQELNLNYTVSETSHLEDVQEITTTANYFFYFTLFICTFIITYYKNNLKQIIKIFLYGGITSLSAIGIIFLFILFSFQSSFIIFHNLFFPQGNWTFPYNSLLIQTFPLDFFISISIKIFLLTIIFSILFILLSFLFKHGYSVKRN
ncbi:DUF1461 domain-containing protein [Candidatus Woesearchaeota archaeon]|jgi:uncharacterized membrane protein|nr:DUF1461 domain-containing protein [Candidatus Woesearchaeota archaeon]